MLFILSMANDQAATFLAVTELTMVANSGPCNVEYQASFSVPTSWILDKEKHILIIFIKKSLDTIKLCDVLYVSILFFHLHLKTPLLTYLTGPSTIKFLISGSKHNYKGRIFKHDSYTTPVQNQLSISIQLFCAKHYHLNKTVYLGSRSSHSC